VHDREAGSSTNALFLDIKVERDNQMLIIESHIGDNGYVQSLPLKQGSQVRDAISHFFPIRNIAVIQGARLPQVGFLGLTRETRKGHASDAVSIPGFDGDFHGHGLLLGIPEDSCGPDLRRDYGFQVTSMSKKSRHRR